MKLKWRAIPGSEAYAEKAILAIKKTRERKATKRASPCPVVYRMAILPFCNLYQFSLHRKPIDDSGEKLPNRNEKKLLDNLRRYPYHN